MLTRFFFFFWGGGRALWFKAAAPTEASSLRYPCQWTGEQIKWYDEPINGLCQRYRAHFSFLHAATCAVLICKKPLIVTLSGALPNMRERTGSHLQLGV